MNIQIFGTKKSADTRKAERFFKERSIKFQSIDLKEKGFSKGELQSVVQAAGGIDVSFYRFHLEQHSTNSKPSFRKHDFLYNSFYVNEELDDDYAD